MAPPELPRNAPVADVVHPFEIGLRPVGGNERDAPVFHRFDRGLGQRLHLHPPLLRNQRLDDGLAAMAFADAQLVRLDLFEQPELLQLRHHLLARFEAIEARESSRRGRHLRVFVDHFDARQIVALARFEIVGIVRGRDLHRAGAELRIGHRHRARSGSRDPSAAAARSCRRSSAARGSFGLIATAVSPSIVSGRVVATTSFTSLPFTG